MTLGDNIRLKCLAHWSWPSFNWEIQFFMDQWRIWAFPLLCVVLSAGAGVAQDKIEVQEYRDQAYGYAFQYPGDWELRKLPEGTAHEGIRVMLQAPNGSSFIVVIEPGEKRISRTEFDADPNRKQYVDKLMQQTWEQIYRMIAANLGATEAKLGDRRDLSNDEGITFYLSMLIAMTAGKPVIVSGIHSYPFSKDYSVSFIMTAFFDQGATGANQVLTAVFNSFHLLAESPPSRRRSTPTEGAGGKAELK